MGFTAAITSGFTNYVNFKNRASRSEYWFWQLFMLLSGLGVLLLDLLLFLTAGIRSQSFSTIWWLATILPDVAVAVRRLHDADRSGWWLLLFFVPLVGWIVLLVWFCTAGTHGYNRFGANPLPAEASLHGAGRSRLTPRSTA
ncbi:MAG TPA: DUF805 domain-containing protein [Xanthobacteraceae bacterium]|nr:DUF805 domain-containing protein [Xanthobacteraceae bacterium]